MRTLPLVVSVVALLALVGCSTPSGGHREYRQAARPAPAPGPLIVQQPPSYPGTTYTPPGTGLPMPGQPAQKPSVPRSPNTRVLPASNEPGLWAADGARASVSSSYLFNIPIPYPPGATSAEDREATDVCVSLMNGFANDVKALDTILSYSREVRECMAARAFQHCAEKFYDGWEANKKAGIEFDAETMRRHLSMLNHANDLVSRLCNGVDTTDEQDRLGARVDVRLDKFLRTGK